MRIAIFIPTTAGPILIEGIHELKALPRSQVLVGTDYIQTGAHGEFSQRYNSLIGPGGPLGKVFNPGGKSFELVISALPSSGRSWELPVGMAHWAHHHRHEIVTEDPDCILWSTGALVGDGRIVLENYELQRKFEQSHELLDLLGQDKVPVHFLFPRASVQSEIPALTGVPNGDAAVVEGLSEALAALDRSVGSVSQDNSRACAQEKPHTFQITAVVLLTFIVIGFLAVPSIVGDTEGSDLTSNSMQPPRDQPQEEGQYRPEQGNDGESVQVPVQTTAASSPDDTLEAGIAESIIELVEYRAPSGTDCLNVLFNRVEPEIHPLSSEDGVFPDSSLDGLCGIGISAVGASRDVRISLDSVFLAMVVRSDRIAEFGISPGETQDFTLGRVVEPSNVDHNFTLSLGGEQLSYSHRLVSQQVLE